jgi:hypothetical protein
MTSLRIAFRVAATCKVSATSWPADEACATADVKEMSFNVRYGTAKDGENHWDRRKKFLAGTITAYGPDPLGTQETLGFQRDFLAKKLMVSQFALPLPTPCRRR